MRDSVIRNWARRCKQAALQAWGRGLGAKHRRWTRYTLGAAWSLVHNLVGRQPTAADIPVIINSFNRPTPLKALVTWLERAGFRQIIILDNNSNYLPLLDYYKSVPHEVIRGPNLGPEALWRTEALWRRVRSRYYIYTDADVVPDPNCPLDVADRFLHLLRWRLGTAKVGFGLRVDNLPDHYAKKQSVIEWESKFWVHEVESGVYRAPIDTTFALYRPFAAGYEGSSLRTGMPYLALHMPWYENSAAPTEEDAHYARSAKSGVSTWLEAKGTF
jgi:hypothetical protein